MSYNTSLDELSKELYIAVRKKKDTSSIQNLLNNGASPLWEDENGRTTFDLAAYNGNLEYLELFLMKGVNVNEKDVHGNTPLHFAARRGNVEICNWFLHKGADVNITNNLGRTTLHSAADGGSVECCELLLNKGINVHAVDNRGNNLLHFAARNHDIEYCKLFINKGINVNSVNNDGDTPLHVAAKYGIWKCVEIFIDKAGDVNLLNMSGNTPLHYAAEFGYWECCNLLIRYNADPNIKNNNGETPLLVLLQSTYLSDNNFKSFKYFFESGAILQKIPKSWFENDKEKNYKKLETCWKWWIKQQNIGQELIDIPKEIFERGSEAIDIYFNEIYNSNNRVFRSRICVVGPSGWGKTSLIKSMISSAPTQVPADLRTIGIDQFQWRFDVAKEKIDLHNAKTTELNNPHESRIKERHHVSFWDFAGQDVYKGAHSIFFASSRTLFLICVNLKLYDDDIMNEHSTASDEILQWIRLIFAKQPNAKLLFVGTKADLVNKYAIQTIREDLSDCVQQWCDKYSTDINTRQLLLSENAKGQHNLQQLQVQLSNIKHAVNRNWVISSSQDKHKLREACAEIQCHISDSNLGFIMPDSYTAVLDYLYQLRQDARSITNISSSGNVNTSNNTSILDDYNSGEILQTHTVFCSQQNLKGRIRTNVQQVNNDSVPKNSSGHETKDMLLDEILELFNDLGEILLFNNMKLNKKNGVVIVDPGLMIDLVRDIVRHDLCQYLENYNENTQIEPDDWKVHLMNGVVCHTTLGLLPTWGKLTSGQKLVAQELLHKCQILYPIGEAKFSSKTNVAVPALLLMNQEMASSIPDMEEEIARWYTDTNGIKRMCWEYEFSANTLPESFFELLIVKNYKHTTEQTVLHNSFKEWVPGTSSLGLITISHSNSSHSVIKVGVASNTKDKALDLLRYYISVIENLLQEYPGVSKTPYYIELKSNGKQIPHVVNSMALTMRLCVHGNEDWLNNNLFSWYLKKPWEDLTKQLVNIDDTGTTTKLDQIIGSLDQLVKTTDIQEKLLNSIIQIQYVGEENRQLPALWTAELDHKNSLSQIRVRMLSDISGKCFHIDKPIEIDVPFKLLSKYGEKLKYGLNVISLVAPRSIRLDKLGISGIVENAEKIHNLIDGCDLQTHGIINTGTDSQMSPNESRLLLIDLLTLHDPKFALDQVPRLSGLVCGFVTGTGHHFWASEEEFQALGDKVTVRNIGPLDVNLLLGTQKYSVDLRVCQVNGLPSTDQKKLFVKWELVDNSNNLTIHEGYTSHYKDALAEPNWKNALWNISLKDFDQLKQLTLRVIVQRSRKLPIYKYREIKELGIGEVALSDILQSYSTTPSNCIPIKVETLLNQKWTCSITCQLEFPTGSAGNNSSTVVP